MKDEEIEKYIDLLNKKTYAETIFIRQISEFVDVAKVWDSFPEVTDLVNNESPSMDFFFIRNERGSYIGAVYVMMNDLHWYIQQAFRKKGYLTKALKKAIIPYLFDVKCKKEIVVTIPPHNEPSKKVAEMVGFELLEESNMSFELTEDTFKGSFGNLYENRSKKLSADRIEILKKRAFFAYKILQGVSDELIMAYNKDKGLSKTIENLREYARNIEEIDHEVKS